MSCLTHLKRMIAALGATLSLLPVSALASPPVITSLSLMSAGSPTVLSAVANGSAIDLRTLPTWNLSIRANVSPALGSVTFQIASLNYTHTEHNFPYDLCNDDASNSPLPCPALANPGRYTLTVTPFDPAGLQGTPLTVALNVVGRIFPKTGRLLYAVNEQAGLVGSISVYNIDRGHRFIRTIPTVPNVGDVRGVVADAKSGRMYVSYIDFSANSNGVGMIYALDLYTDTIVWNNVIPPGVDRLSISPDGQTLFVPSSEENVNPAYNFVNFVNAADGTIRSRVVVANQTHDALYPVSGPLFQECKATDGSCDFLFKIDPSNNAVSRMGPFSDFLGPFSIDGASNYAVINVNDYYGMQVANLRTGQIIQAPFPGTPQSGLLHGIGWTPDATQVWEADGTNPQVGIWNMANPMSPQFSGFLPIANATGSHWLTFSIRGDYAYVAPQKSESSPTEVFNVSSRTSVARLDASEDMLEVDFTRGIVMRVGNQYGIGRN